MAGPRRTPRARLRAPRARRAADAGGGAAKLSPRPADGTLPPLRAEYEGLGAAPARGSREVPGHPGAQADADRGVGAGGRTAASGERGRGVFATVGRSIGALAGRFSQDGAAAARPAGAPGGAGAAAGGAPPRPGAGARGDASEAPAQRLSGAGGSPFGAPPRLATAAARRGADAGAPAAADGAAGRGGSDARSAEARLAQGPPEPGAAAAPRRPAGQGGPARAASQSLPGPGEPAAARAAAGERAGSDGELGELSWTARRRAQTLLGPCPAPGDARHAACLGYVGVARSGRRRCGAPEPRRPPRPLSTQRTRPGSRGSKGVVLRA